MPPANTPPAGTPSASTPPVTTGSTASDRIAQAPMRGYLEGYYGRLPSWQERDRVLEALASLGMNTYFYAPKEDTCHRLDWRRHYPPAWRQAFSTFCQRAAGLGITVIAGVAPGLDIDFSSFPDGEDIDTLCEKARRLRADGADSIALLMDDIDANFDQRSGQFSREGEAHAALVNLLAERLDEAVFAVPRVYANEIAVDAPAYLDDFLTTLDRQHPVFYCGRHIVASQPLPSDWQTLVQPRGHRVVIWDNLYANDYCPRRLFVGPWLGREQAAEILLNPTGMIATDLLLLDMMATFSQPAPATAASRWRQVLDRHGVPAAFTCLAAYFDRPPAPEVATGPLPAATAEHFEAIETCLWRWKTPLSREWYPHLMGLKHDLLLAAGRLPDERIHKTQSAPLAARLLQQRLNDSQPVAGSDG